MDTEKKTTNFSTVHTYVVRIIYGGPFFTEEKNNVSRLEFLIFRLFEQRNLGAQNRIGKRSRNFPVTVRAYSMLHFVRTVLMKCTHKSAIFTSGNKSVLGEA